VGKSSSGLTAKEKKCEFFQDELLNKDGINVENSKVECIRTWKRPETVIHWSIGVINDYLYPEKYADRLLINL
jgi:hypothetical protein